jgi:hypothetical protein
MRMLRRKITLWRLRRMLVALDVAAATGRSFRRPV